MDRYALEIPGFTDASPEPKPVVTPFTREPIAEVDQAPDEALEVALTNARTIQDASWRKVP